MLRFGKISEIIPEEKASWEDKIFLTFDCDWAHDEIIEDTLNLVEQWHAPSTFYITHDSPILERLKANKYIEHGIHPNFNLLLSGTSTHKNDFKDVINQVKSLVPDACAARAHSLVCGSPIEAYYRETQITHDSSLYIPHQFNSYQIQPSRTFHGGIKCPYFYCDFGACFHKPEPITELTLRCGLKIFDFHPIHVFLNSESPDRYERTRMMHERPRELIAHRFHGEGARTRLMELLMLIYKNAHASQITQVGECRL